MILYFFFCTQYTHRDVLWPLACSMSYRATRANHRPTYNYGKLLGGRGGGSSEMQRLGAPDDEDEDAGEEVEVDRYIASIRQGTPDFASLFMINTNTFIQVYKVSYSYSYS